MCPARLRSYQYVEEQTSSRVGKVAFDLHVRPLTTDSVFRSVDVAMLQARKMERIVFASQSCLVYLGMVPVLQGTRSYM